MAIAGSVGWVASDGVLLAVRWIAVGVGVVGIQGWSRSFVIVAGMASAWVDSAGDGYGGDSCWCTGGDSCCVAVVRIAVMSEGRLVFKGDGLWSQRRDWKGVR